MKYIIKIIAKEKWRSNLPWTQTARGYEKIIERFNLPMTFDDLNKTYRYCADIAYDHVREVLEYHE